MQVSKPDNQHKDRVFADHENSRLAVDADQDWITEWQLMQDDPPQDRELPAVGQQMAFVIFVLAGSAMPAMWWLAPATGIEKQLATLKGSHP